MTKGGGGEGYCYSDFASLMQNDEILRKNPETSRQALRGPNKVVSEDWERVVAQTPRNICEQKTTELSECLEALVAWEESTVALFPKGPRGQTTAPSLTNIRHALTGCHDTAAAILATKPAPPPEPPSDLVEEDDDQEAADSLDGDGRADGIATATAATTTARAAPSGRAARVQAAGAPWRTAIPRTSACWKSPSSCGKTIRAILCRICWCEPIG